MIPTSKLLRNHTDIGTIAEPLEGWKFLSANHRGGLCLSDHFHAAAIRINHLRKERPEGVFLAEDSSTGMMLLRRWYQQLLGNETAETSRKLGQAFLFQRLHFAYEFQRLALSFSAQGPNVKTGE